MAEKSLNDLPRDLRILHTRGSDALTRDNFDYAIDVRQGEGAEIIVLLGHEDQAGGGCISGFEILCHPHGLGDDTESKAFLVQGIDFPQDQ